jgi:colanic acid biosynthesis glycosyl transferase WcaI
MSELLATADIHLLPQRAEAADLVLPSKLAGMLASGRPIVAMANAGTGLAAAIKGVGVAVPTGSGDVLGRAVAALAGDADLRQQYGKEARRVALAEWNRSTIIAALELQLERTLGRRLQNLPAQQQAA